MRLTKSAVSKIELPVGKMEIIVFDDTLKGFGLRVRAGGKRTWIVQYRLGTAQRRLALGQVDAVDADEARRHAKAALAKVSLGEDPAEAKAEALASRKVTLNALLPQYLEWMRTRVGACHHGNIARYLGKDWAVIGDLPLASIKRRTISAQYPSLVERHGGVAANRARAALSRFFSWAVAEGLSPENPVKGSNVPFKEESRKRLLSNDELRLMWDNSGDGDFGTILKLLGLTAARASEIAALHWSELDGSAWTLPSERSKNDQPLLLDLPRTAMSLLDSVPVREGRDLVFGLKGPFSGFAKAKRNLDKRMLAQWKKERGRNATIPHWILHDIRRTVATGMGEIGVAPHIIECVLNHVGGFRSGVGGIYNKARYQKQMKKALEKWEAHLLKIVNAKPRR